MVKLKIPSDPRGRSILFAIISSAIIVAGAFAASVYSINMSGNTPRKVMPLSNISANISIEPSMYSPSIMDGKMNLSGAWVEIWPVMHPVSSSPSYVVYSNVSPMVSLWINTSWHASVRLPLTFMDIMHAWERYFMNSHGGKTSLVVMISYVAEHNSTTDAVYTYTTASPYNPFTVNRTSMISISVHPAFPMKALYVKKGMLSFPEYPIYTVNGEYLYGRSGYLYKSESLYRADHLPFPGGSSTYWTWVEIKSENFVNAWIPISFLNVTDRNVDVLVTDSISIGSTSLNTEFSLAKSFDYSGSKSYEMGTSAFYTAGLYFGSNSTESKPGSLALHDGVIAIKGNVTIMRYQWVKLSSTGRIVERSNKYQTDMGISSLNHSGDQFHIKAFAAGHVNLKKYTNSEYKNLSLQERYSLAMGIYFNGTDSAALWGNQNSTENITTLNYLQKVSWNTIYSNITAFKNDVEGEILAGLGLLVAMVSVDLALAAVPWSDAVTIPSIIISLIGYGVSVASLFESGIISVTSSTVIYGGYIKNYGFPNSNGGSPITVYNWYTPQDVEINGNTYQIPTNYPIIKPAS